MSADTPRRLGRGLEALISTARQQRAGDSSAPAAVVVPLSDLKTVRIADITPNRFQPPRYAGVQ